MPPFGSSPYAPGNSRISEIILRAGDAQARAQLEKGAIWSGLAQNLGNIAGQAVEQYGVQKAASEREKAWGEYLDAGDWDNDPLEAYKTSQKIFGREDGNKAFEGLMAVRQLTQGKVKTPEQAQEYLGTAAKTAKGMSDEQLAKYWPALRAAVGGFNQATGAQLEIGEAYDPSFRPQIVEFADAFAKQEAKKTREIKTRGPGGVETTRIVEDVPGQEFVSAPEPTKPISVGGSLVQVGPGGEVSELYRAPEKPAGPGAHTWVLREGQPVRVSESEIRPGDQPYESPKAAVKKMPAGSAETLADLSTSLDDVATLRETLAGTSAGTGTVARAAGALPGVLTEAFGWGADAKARQATIDRVKQVVGKALEGGVLRKEDEEKYKKILPVLSDPPSVAKAKLEGLEKAISQKRTRQLESLSDAGYDTTAFEAREAGIGADLGKNW